MPMSKSKPASEAEMMAQSDMYTLVEAEKIRKEPSRYKAAMNAFRKKYKEMEDMKAAMEGGGDKDKSSTSAKQQTKKASNSSGSSGSKKMNYEGGMA